MFRFVYIFNSRIKQESKEVDTGDGLAAYGMTPRSLKDADGKAAETISIASNSLPVWRFLGVNLLA